MKSIRNIFKNNKHLMDEPEVQELIDYCTDLEGSVLDNKMSEQYDMEKNLSFLVKEIYESCCKLIKQDEENDRWPELNDRPDYKSSVSGLKEYIENFARENKFRL